MNRYWLAGEGVFVLLIIFVIDLVTKHIEQLKEYELLEKGIKAKEIRGTWSSTKEDKEEV